jgi:hypothetical protein
MPLHRQKGMTLGGDIDGPAEYAQAESAGRAALNCGKVTLSDSISDQRQRIQPGSRYRSPDPAPSGSGWRRPCRHIDREVIA